MPNNFQRTYRKKINVNLVQPKSKQPQLANIISSFALVVSIVLAFYTYKVFQIANSQNESVIKSASASVKSAETAENTLKETKRYNKEYLDLQRELFKSSDEDSRKRSQRDSLSLNAQIKSIKENEKEFKIGNIPNLQMGDIETISLENSRQGQFDANIYNLGKQSVKSLSIQMQIYGRPKKDSTLFMRSFIKIPIAPVTVLNYLNPQKPTKITFHSNQNSADTIVGFMKKKFIVFIVGNVRYINYTNNKVRNYTFVLDYKYNQPGVLALDFLYNENTDDK